MTEKPIDLDARRGMAAQKATDLRRLLSEVEANEKILREHQGELEAHLLAAPAATWPEAAEKARYVLALYTTLLPPFYHPKTPAAAPWSPPSSMISIGWRARANPRPEARGGT